MLFQCDINMHVTMIKGASSCKVGFSCAKSGFEDYIGNF
jgi:hypothetical protein